LRGRFFEDFMLGDIYRHPLGRTVTTTDNIWFMLLRQNTAPTLIHNSRRLGGAPNPRAMSVVRGAPERMGAWRATTTTP
jgi:hypothetical protein